MTSSYESGVICRYDPAPGAGAPPRLKLLGRKLGEVRFDKLGPGNWMTQRRVPTCIVGYGYWGPNLARNVAMGATTELVAICDSDPESRKRARKQHPTVPVIEAWEDVLGDPEIEAVVIALPMGMHFRYTLAALEAGKHVMVEKPLAAERGRVRRRCRRRRPAPTVS